MTSSFVLTVMPDYGMAPFLWFRRGFGDGLGGNCCDASGPCGGHPMSLPLWQQFVDWAAWFGTAPIVGSGSSAELPAIDWPRFHAWGLSLARWLKLEVGPNYKVVYMKPVEDPAALQDGACWEVVSAGDLLEVDWRNFIRAECLFRMEAPMNSC